MIDWFFDWLIDWMLDGLMEWLIDWLIDCSFASFILRNNQNTILLTPSPFPCLQTETLFQFILAISPESLGKYINKTKNNSQSRNDLGEGKQT